MLAGGTDGDGGRSAPLVRLVVVVPVRPRRGPDVVLVLVVVVVVAVVVFVRSAARAMIGGNVTAAPESCIMIGREK